jgi:hypothetical protein
VGLFKSKAGRGRTAHEDVYLEPVNNISALNAIQGLLDAQKEEFRRRGMRPLGSSPQSSGSESPSQRRSSPSLDDYGGPATSSRRRTVDARYHLGSVSEPKATGLKYPDR